MPIYSDIPGINAAGLIKSSFRVRLFSGISLVILLVCSAFASLLIYQQYRSQEEKLKNEGALMAKLLARDVRLALFSGSRDEIILSAKGVMSLPEVQSVEVFDRNGLLMARLSVPTDENSNYSTFVEFVPGLLNVNMEKSLFVGKLWGGDPKAAIGSVKVVVNEGSAEKHILNLVYTSVAATLIFVSIGIIAAFYLARSMARPIVELSGLAHSFMSGDDRVYAHIETPDELGHLAHSFNSMVEAIRLRTKDLEEALEELYQLNVALEDKVERRTAQLESANKELESFNYSASHDLRAPLTRLAGYCAAFREEYGSLLDEQGFYFLDRIAATGQQMDLVLSALLTLYQIQQREMTPRELDLSELVTAVAGSLRQREEERNVEFVIKENVTAFGDMKLLWLALENIIGNAWKFTRECKGARIEFGTEQQNNNTVYYISDNGAGFDMHYYDKLFKPFQRLHNQEEFPGTGVGLAIVQRIISRHGGKIWLDSTLGKGTCCRFILPGVEAPTVTNK